MDADMMREEAEQLAREETRRWTARYPEVSLQVVVDCRAPVRRLIEESAAAGLLVVGSRSHGGIAGLLLGSVGQAVIRHAACPVAVVHGRVAIRPARNGWCGQAGSVRPARPTAGGPRPGCARPSWWRPAPTTS